MKKLSKINLRKINGGSSANLTDSGVETNTCEGTNTVHDAGLTMWVSSDRTYDGDWYSTC